MPSTSGPLPHAAGPVVSEGPPSVRLRFEPAWRQHGLHTDCSRVRQAKPPAISALHVRTIALRRAGLISCVSLRLQCWRWRGLHKDRSRGRQARPPAISALHARTIALRQHSEFYQSVCRGRPARSVSVFHSSRPPERASVHGGAVVFLNRVARSHRGAHVPSTSGPLPHAADPVVSEGRPSVRVRVEPAWRWHGLHTDRSRRRQTKPPCDFRATRADHCPTPRWLYFIRVTSVAVLARARQPHGPLAGATSEAPSDFSATRADHRPTPNWPYIMRVTSVAVLAGARPPHGPFAGATSEALSDFRATRADHRPTPACRVLSISLPGEDCPVF